MTVDPRARWPHDPASQMGWRDGYRGLGDYRRLVVFEHRGKYVAAYEEGLAARIAECKACGGTGLAPGEAREDQNVEMVPCPDCRCAEVEAPRAPVTADERRLDREVGR